MSTYREIVGKKIKKVSSDPSTGLDGEMWYNSATGSLRALAMSSGWSSSSPLTTAREGGGSLGTQTASLYVGGESPPVVNITEEYNGTGWTTGGNMNTTRYRTASAGILTAGLIFGGYAGPPVPTGVKNSTESYNGTSWTSSPHNLNTARTSAGGAGTSTSALCFGGSNLLPPTYYMATTESYDGEGWSSENNMNTARQGLVGAGASESAVVAFGGYTSSPPTVSSNSTETWDGTNWTAANNMNTARYLLSGDGTQTAAIAAGGIDGPSTYKNSTETWDGTDWTAAPNMATGRGILGGAGTSPAFVVFGGASPLSSATEEYNSSTNAITAAAWSSGGALPITVAYNQGGGTQTAGLSMSGQPGPTPAATTSVFEYNGAAWTAGGVLAPGAASYGGQASKNGTQTAMLYWKGHYAGNKNTVSSYDGSSWTAQPTFPNSDVYGGGCGTSTAALSVGGFAPAPPYVQATCFEGDGSYNWTSSPALGTARYNNVAVGTQTNAVTAGGQTPPNIAKTEEYNGSSWSEKSDMIASRTGNTKDQGFGTNSDDLMIAGGPPNSALCIQWDGTAWSTRPSMGTGRHGGAGAGASSTSGLVAGGTAPHQNTTEEFTGETSALNIEDFTTS